MEVQGKIISVLPVQSGTSSKGSWEKHGFVVEWSENGYTQRLCLEVMGADKWEKMEKAVHEGNMVLVRYGVSSREYQGRWFTSANCFYCSTIGEGDMGAQTHSEAASDANRVGNSESTSTMANNDNGGGGGDDLPF